MAAGQRIAVFAIGVERIFDDVVALDAHGMDEERTGEVAKPEAFGNRRAVEREGCACDGQRFLPARQFMAVLVEEAEPERGVDRAMQRPVVGAFDARMNAVRTVPAFHFAQQRKVRREVHRVEIVLLVRQHLVGNAHHVERDDAGILREEMANGEKDFLCVIEKNEHRLGV